MTRTKKYPDEQVLADTIEEYFEQCRAAEKSIMPNKAGLCLFLGISRDTYSEYRNAYPDTIKWADNHIENAWVQRLGGNAPTGAIFYLKNAFGYRDRQETDITSGGNVISGFNFVGSTATKALKNAHNTSMTSSSATFNDCDNADNQAGA